MLRALPVLLALNSLLLASGTLLAVNYYLRYCWVGWASLGGLTMWVAMMS